MADEQNEAEFTRLFFQGTGYPGDSEDCLYLNVYAPEGGCGNRSVIFWLYGGQLQSGTAMQDLYDGSSFAAHQDVIVVSANYRTNGMVVPCFRLIVTDHFSIWIFEFPRDPNRRAERRLPRSASGSGLGTAQYCCFWR